MGSPARCSSMRAPSFEMCGFGCASRLNSAIAASLRAAIIESAQFQADGYLLTKTMMDWFWNHYLRDSNDSKNPYVSPLLAKDLSGLPQAVVYTAEFDPLRDEGIAFAEALKGAGYATGHFGKWHLGHGKGYEPKDRGFDVDIPHTPRAAGPGGGYLAPWKFVQDPEFKGADGEHIDYWMAGQAGKFMEEAKGKPFYVNFWLYSVHGPWNARKADVDAFGKTADPKNPQHNPLYAAMIKGMDDAVGRLLDALEKSGVAK